MTSKQIKFYRIKKFLKAKIIENDSGERKPDCFAYNTQCHECEILLATDCKNCKFYKSKEEVTEWAR